MIMHARGRCLSKPCPLVLTRHGESTRSCLSSDRSRSNGSSAIGDLGREGSSGDGSNRCSIAVEVGLLVALTGDVSSLTAAVAGLAGSVERTAVGSSAVTRDVSELTASVAFHGLSLAVASEVVGTTALVAGSRTSAAGKAAAEATKATTRTGSTTASTSAGSRASAL